MTDHATLRTLAEAATHGRWEMREYVLGGGRIFKGSRLIADVYSQKDQAYIRAASPDRILALLDELETLRAALRGLLGTHGGPCRLGDDCPAVTMARAALAGSGR